MDKKLNNKFFMVLLLGLVSIFFIALSSATLITPASSATLSQNVNMNATNTSLPSMLNCSFYAWSSLSANTSQTVIIANSLNLTANAPMVNVTFNTTGLEDASDYSFKAACYNGTANVNSTNTGITIDNTNPTAPTLSSPATATSITTSTTQTFTCAVNNPTTTGCTIYLGRNGAYSASSADSIAAAMTYSASTCTYSKTFSTQTDNGEWYWSCESSDGSDTTASAATNILHVLIPGNVGGGAQVRSNVRTLSVASGSPGGSGIGTLVLIILAIIIVYFFFKKKR